MHCGMFGEEPRFKCPQTDFRSCAIEGSMFLSHGIWLLRTRKIRGRAKAAHVEYDEFPEAQEWQDKAIKVDFSRFRRSNQPEVSQVAV